MRILIVDDHAILRKGLIKLLIETYPDAEFHEASNGIEGLGLLMKMEFDIALVDISMPEMDGVEMLKQVQHMDLDVPVIIVSMLPEDQFAVRVLKAGASGFLKKTSPSDEVQYAVKRVLAGKKYIPEDVADILATSIGRPAELDPIDTLSDRELQVFRYIARGLSVSEIADDIGISVNTVSTYRSRILEKLGLKNNSGIIRLAIEYKII